MKAVLLFVNLLTSIGISSDLCNLRVCEGDGHVVSECVVMCKYRMTQMTLGHILNGPSPISYSTPIS